ncbi:MAG: hypothetical protein AAGJ82_01100 [Bacteroidota bacterium]
MYRFLLLFVYCLVCGVACSPTSSEPEATPVFADFYVRYLADAQQLRAQAKFKTGDSLAVAQPLPFPRGVAFQGSNLQEKSLASVLRYESSRTLAYTTPLRFTFQLPEQTEQTTIEVDMVGLDTFTITQASVQDGLRLEINTELKDSESLVLFFTNPDGEARTIIRQGPSRLKQLFIAPDALVHFVPGDYRMYIVKRQLVEEQQGELSYQAIVEYYTKEVAFAIEQ